MVILAKVLYKFEKAQAGDLALTEDEIITIVSKDDSGWWTGRTMSGRQGDFPFNFVEVLDPEATTAYLKRAEKDLLEEPKPMEFKGSKITTLQLVVMENGIGGAPAMMTFESTLSDGSRVQVGKSITELRAFDEQLRTVLPDFEGKLPPTWGDKADLLESRAERRKDAIEAYVKKLVNMTDGADFLLVPFLVPGKQVEMGSESFAAAAKAREQAKLPKKPEPAVTLARADYSWETTDPVELGFDAGDVISVLNQSTGSEGWWEGQTADGARGLFPNNHVALLSEDNVKNFMTGQRLVTNDSAKYGKTQAPRPNNIVSNFALNSLQAFDDLIDKGVALENIGGTSSGPSPRVGDKIVLSYKAYIWNCQTQSIVEFISSEDAGEGPMEFLIGNDPSVCKGLHRAVQRLWKGVTARVIVAPKLGYGVAGFPPAIPPLSTLVYDIEVKDIMDAAALPSKSKPEVKSRSESQPRVLSMRSLVPVFNRSDKKGSQAPSNPPAEAASPAAAAVVPSATSHGGAPGTEEGAEPQRRAGHVMIDKTVRPASLAAAAAPAPPPPRKMYALKELQEMLTKGQIEKEGLDRAVLEDHLTDEAFFEAFLMDRGHFLLKPLWRQQALKRSVGLF